MTDAAEIADAPPGETRKKGKLGLLLGMVLAVGLGGGGYYAVYTGIIDLMGLLPRAAAESVLGDVAFVPMEPIMISLPPGASAKLLRFAGQLEVAPEHAAEVAGLMPRVLDVLNTYLRAVDVARSGAAIRARPAAGADAAADPGGDRRGPGARPAHHRIRAELGARMDLLMNGLLLAATLFAGGYCWVLARRVRDLKSLDRGLGGSIVTLTRQIELARPRWTRRAPALEGQPPRPHPAHRAAPTRRAASSGSCSPGRRAACQRRRAPAPTAAPEPMPAALRRAARAGARRCGRREPPLAAAAPEPAARPGRAAPRGGAEAARARRRREPAAPRQGRRGRAPRHSEDEILEALSALAGSGGR